MNGIGNSSAPLDELETTKQTPMLKKENIKEAYVLSPFRWILCICFMIQQAGYGIGMVGYSTISPLVRDVYGITNIEVSLLVLCYTILFIPINFPANFLVEKHGIAIPIRIGCIALVIGALARLFLHNGFYFILTGQSIMAAGLPFCQTLGAKIAAVWFGDHERAFATTISSIAIIFGVVVGFAFPIFFLSDDDKDNPDVKDKLWFYTLIQSIVLCVCAVPAFIFIKNKPSHPPSKSAKQALRHKDLKFVESLKQLCKIMNYWLIVLSYSLVFSIYKIKIKL